MPMKRIPMSRGKARRPSSVRADEQREAFWRMWVGRGKIRLGGRKTIKRVKMPKTRSEFLRDTAIGKFLANRSDALPRREIMEKFGLSEAQFDERAMELEPLVQIGNDELVKRMLYAAGEQVRKEKEEAAHGRNDAD